MKRLFTIFLILQLWAVPALAALVDCVDHAFAQHAQTSPSDHSTHQAKLAQTRKAVHNHGGQASLGHEQEQPLADEQCCMPDMSALAGTSPGTTKVLVSKEIQKLEILQPKSIVRSTPLSQLDLDYANIYLRTLRIRI